MSLLAEPSSPRAVLLTAPSAARDDPTLSLLAFTRWTRRSLVTPPRTVLLTGGALQPEFRRQGARVIGNPFSPLRYVERTLRRLGWTKPAKAAQLTLYASIFRQPTQPRCIYVSTLHGAGPALRFRTPDARVVVHAHETGEMLDELVNPNMMQRLRAGVDTWVAASDAVAAGLEERGIGAGRIVRCDPFIERPTPDARRVEAATRSLALRPGEVVIGGIGGSNWQDAPDVFIRVAAMVTRRWPDLAVRFVWVGAPVDGPTRWILDHDIRNAGLEGRVSLVGDLGDVDTWLATFDVLALTSRIGTLSSVAMQAGALAVPAVAFDHHAAPLDTDAQIGTRTVPYLDVEAMATELHELVGDAALRATIGEQAQRHVLDHGLVEQKAGALWELLERSAQGRVANLEAAR